MSISGAPARQAKERQNLKTQLEDAARADPTEDVQNQIDELEKNLKFYLRPRPGEVDRSLFGALQGGLIFTGLFRTRFEYRDNNFDFNSDGDKGLDDTGVRLAVAPCRDATCQPCTCGSQRS